MMFYISIQFVRILINRYSLEKLQFRDGLYIKYKQQLQFVDIFRILVRIFQYLCTSLDGVVFIKKRFDYLKAYVLEYKILSVVVFMFIIR